MPTQSAKKTEAELAFWESRVQQQGRLSNAHYEYFYTAHFGLEKAFYRGKKILDIGCGPRGSLEWAAEAGPKPSEAGPKPSSAGLRIGADPLAEAYRRLGTARHAMQYAACEAENLPFPEGFFEIVCAFNSLDHVDQLEKVICEISRVTAPGGLCLLLTDVHQQPTLMEPSAFSWEVVDRFLPAFELVEHSQVEYTVFSPEGYGDMYQSLQRGVPYNVKDARVRDGILSAKFRKPR
jgi:ubiquinone/menaquinone biosynthesis C-methylase UbiE